MLEVVEAFIGQKTRSPRTLEFYRSDLQAFVIYVKSQWDKDSDLQHALVCLSPDMAQQYVNVLKSEGYKPSSIKRKIACLRSFYNFCVEEKKIAESPMCRVVTPVVPKTIKPLIDDPEITKLFDAMQGGSFETHRDRVVVNLILSCGVKASEMPAIRAQDVVVEGSRITLSKEKETVAFDVSETLANEVGAYVDRRRDFAGCDRLIVNRYGRPISERSIRRKIEKYAQLAGIVIPRLSSSLLRRHAQQGNYE